MAKLDVFVTNVRKCFAERLRDLREEKGLTQGELGTALGVSRGSISYYENMDRVPDIEFLVKVTNYFGVATDYMLGHSDNALPLYQDIGLALGLSDKAIGHILDIDYLCGEETFNSILESDHFIRLAEIINVYFWGGWGFSIPYETETKILDKKDHGYVANRKVINSYKAESQYTEFLMTKAILAVLKDMRKEYEKKAKSWKEEMPVSEEALFNTLVDEVDSLVDEYNRLRRSEVEVAPCTIEDAYKKLIDKWHELDAFKIGYAKVADFKRRLEKIERAINGAQRTENFSKEGETNG